MNLPYCPPEDTSTKNLTDQLFKQQVVIDELVEALKALLEGRPTKEPLLGDFPKEKSIAYKNWVLFENARKAIRKAEAKNA